MDDFRINLEALKNDQNRIPENKVEAFRNYFIGALSSLVPVETWIKALKTAKTCLEKEGVDNALEKHQGRIQKMAGQ